MGPLDFPTPDRGNRGFSSYLNFPADTGVFPLTSTLGEYQGAYVMLGGTTPSTLPSVLFVKNTGTTPVQLTLLELRANGAPTNPYGTADFSQSFTDADASPVDTEWLVPGASQTVGIPFQGLGTSALFLGYSKNITTGGPDSPKGAVEVKITTPIEHTIISLPEA